MSKLTTAIKLFKSNRSSFCASLLENMNFLFPDKLYLQLLFYCKMGYKLNLNSPKTFSEKLQWLKLYNRDSRYTTFVDKYAVKDYVSSVIGKEHVIPSFGVWQNANEIDFDKLPHQFVLKTTNGGGGDVIICKDKSKLDKKWAVKHLNEGLKKSIYGVYREWPYKNVPPRIIAEKYMEDESGALRDYKIFCFNGQPKAFLLYNDRYSGKKMTIDFFDENGKWLDLTHPEFGRSDIQPALPNCFDDLLSLAKKLSQDIPFVRTDFYVVNNNILFGEMTFYPTSGFASYKPQRWEECMGEWLRLPSKERR